MNMRFEVSIFPLFDFKRFKTVLPHGWAVFYAVYTFSVICPIF